MRVSGSTSLVTTAPAATTAFSPLVSPPMIVAPAMLRDKLGEIAQAGLDWSATAANTRKPGHTGAPSQNDSERSVPPDQSVPGRTIERMFGLHSEHIALPGSCGRGTHGGANARREAE